MRHQTILSNLDAALAKMIDARGASHRPPVETGGYKMIDADVVFRHALGLNPAVSKPVLILTGNDESSK